MSRNIVTLDVREDLRQGREPFSRIMQAVAGLAEGEALRLLAPMEPVPLFGVLARQGFTHQARPTDSGDWEILFTRGAERGLPEESGPKRTPATSHSVCDGAPVVEVDARGLEPPQPLVVILEALAVLPAGATLRARTDRQPMHLDPKLHERGFVGESEAQPDGSFVTHIRHA